MGPGDLARALSGLPVPSDPAVLVGLDMPDDAGVYRLSDDVALVQTVDFLTPIVDDPFTFGAIASANALSDVYAMGGAPLTAMNVVCFPSSRLDVAVLRRILEGSLAVLAEAGCALVGGHSVVDEELKFGLSVTGRVHPDRVWRKGGGRPGDVLVLTKPIGTGVVATLARRGGGAAGLDEAVASMRRLNQAAAAALARFDVHAATDVTGFGLLGHAAQMVACRAEGLVLQVDAVPLLPGARAASRAGARAGGLARNRAHFEAVVDGLDGVDEDLAALLFDPQTSGGLLAALPRTQADDAIAALREGGDVGACVVGEVTSTSPARILVR